MKFRLLFKAASIYVLAGIANGAIPFMLLPILTRILPPSGYGKIVMFSSVLAVFSAFVGLSVHGSVSVRYFDKSINHARYLATSIAILILSAAISIFLIALFGEQLSRYIGISRMWLFVAVLAAAAQFMVQLRLLMWQVTHNALKYSILMVLQTLFNVTASLFFVLRMDLGWEGRGYGMVFSMFVFGIIALISMQLSNIIVWKFSFAYAKSMLKFGIPLIIHSVGGLLMSTSDKFTIAGLLGIEEAGVYAAAMQIGLIFSVISEACNKSFAPWLFKILSKGDKREKFTIVNYTYLLFFIIPVLALLFGYVAGSLMQFVAGSQYQGSSGVVLYISLGGGFGAMYFLVVNYIFYAEKTTCLACVTIFSGMMNVIIAIILVRHNGLVGAAQAYMVSQAICFVLTWIVAANVYPMPWMYLAKNLAVLVKYNK